MTKDLTCCKCGKTETVARFGGVSEGDWCGCEGKVWCFDCAHPQYRNEDEELAAQRERRGAVRQESMIADIELAA